MYRTVKTTDKPAASSGNSYCLVSTHFIVFSLFNFFLFLLYNSISSSWAAFVSFSVASSFLFILRFLLSISHFFYPFYKTLLWIKDKSNHITPSHKPTPYIYIHIHIHTCTYSIHAWSSYTCFYTYTCILVCGKFKGVVLWGTHLQANQMDLGKKTYPQWEVEGDQQIIKEGNQMDHCNKKWTSLLLLQLSGATLQGICLHCVYIYTTIYTYSIVTLSALRHRLYLLIFCCYSYYQFDYHLILFYYILTVDCHVKNQL